MLQYLKIFFLIIQVFISVIGFSQNEFNSTEEMQEAAKDLFSKEQYTQAFPIYSQLLSLDRTNLELNYRFGVCLLYSDRSDTYAPIAYLKKALEEVDDSEIYYHMGFAYHINYNFPAAISFYKKYLNKTDNAKKSFDVNRKIEMCQNGMELLKSVKDLFVLQKSEVSRQEFFRSYDLGEFEGRIIKKPENFQNKEDHKSKEKDFIYFNSKAKEIYYSAYGKQNKDHKDIYRRTKLKEGGWSEPMPLSSVINTPYDEDYAVMMPDGITLYFSSNGHNTIGGYDIFKSVFDEVTRTWSVPENINFPFNTPVDDILFISDSSETSAWFASVRNSVEDKIMVYKVGIIKRPEGSNDLAAIYLKNNELDESDLGSIQDRAKLDVNISEQEYQEIPVLVSDPLADAHSQTGADILSSQLKQKQLEQQLIDSASALIISIEQNIHDFEKAQQFAMIQATNKKEESSSLKLKVTDNLRNTQETNDLNELKELVASSNILMAEAERLDYEVMELENAARNTLEKIDEQKMIFYQLNQKYGDAERAIIHGNSQEAVSILKEMQDKWDSIYSSPDQNANMVKEGMASTNIQYPQELENIADFKAFAISTQKDQTQHIEAFSSRFEVYLPMPSITNAKVEQTGFSEDPFKKVEEYMSILQEESKQLNAQIAKNELSQTNLLESFDALDEAQKEQQLLIINKNLEEKMKLQNELQWVMNSSEELGKVYAPQNNEIEDQNVQSEKIQKKTQELENTFDFEKKTFTSLPDAAMVTTAYVINDQGNIEKSSSGDIQSIIEEESLAISENQLKLLDESGYMIIEAEKALAQYNTDIDHAQLKEQELNTLAQNAFNQANEYILLAKSSSSPEKEDYLNRANDQYGIVNKTIEKIVDLQQTQEKLLEIAQESGAVHAQMTNQFRQLENAYKAKENRLTEQLFQDLTIDYEKLNEVRKATDSMLQITMATEPVAIFESNAEVQPYKLNDNGQVVKNIGYHQKPWTSIEEFKEDREIGNVENQQFELSSELGIVADYKQLLSNGFPEYENTNQGILLKEINIADAIRQSDDPKLQEAINEVDHLQEETKNLIKDRNQLLEYYQRSIKKAEELEQLSFNALQQGAVTLEILQKANQLSLDSKKSLFVASEVGGILQDYDLKIMTNSEVLSKSVIRLDQMGQFLQQNNEEEADAVNNQWLEDMAGLNKGQVNTQGFDFVNNVLPITYPEVFENDLMEEYQIIDGQVHRAAFPDLAIYLQIPSSVIVLNVVSSPLISALNDPISDDDLVAENDAVLERSAQNTPSLAITDVNDVVPDDGQLMRAAPSQIDSSQILATSINHQELVPQNSILDSAADTEIAIRKTIKEKTEQSNNYIKTVDFLGVSMTNKAEEKMNRSNEFSLQLENTTDPQDRKSLQDSAEYYLFQALALKAVIEDYQNFENSMKAKQENLASYALNIDTQYNLGNTQKAFELFKELQNQDISFMESPGSVLDHIISRLSSETTSVKSQMDAAFSLSTEKANESVKLLTEASEVRAKAANKRSAFKRRELSDEAESKEQRAAAVLNESEIALSQGNTLYQQSRAYEALSDMEADFIMASSPNQGPPVAAHRALVFEAIEGRKAEMLNGQFDSVLEEDREINQVSNILEVEDLHVYERENFRAEMLTEELELIKREIAILLQSQNQTSTLEYEQINVRVSDLREKADSLEYEANKAFELASSIMATLSEEEQNEARKTSRDFNVYLNDLKGKVEVLLSEASSLKQRALRNNDQEASAVLLKQAKDKEEVAIYLILEEFEVIAQKNKTRLRKNHLILEQLLMDEASPQERELMRNIFSQIDDYFEQARVKREKASQQDISFHMKKILLQDAYSLEMKALDLQMKAKAMLQNHDIEEMMAYQTPDVKEEYVVAQLDKENLSNDSNKRINVGAGNESLAETRPMGTESEEVVELTDVPQEGLVYKIQILAIREFVPNSYFPGVSDITAELVEGTDFVRYFSGEFTDLDNALIRRNSLRVSGYPNAFIRSWQNGNTISLLELQNEESQIANSLSVGSTTRTSIGNVDFSTTNISALQGVYYTVQVGVFSRPRTSAMLYGISPLYHKRMQNGYWVYYSGIYQSIFEANIRKVEIVNQGVSDAFIVAFNNGEPISLANAQQELNSGGLAPIEEDVLILEEASLQIENDWNLNQDQAISNNSDVSFKVQIGVYSNPINLDWIGKQLDGNYLVDSYQSVNGKYVYTVGSFSEEQGARDIIAEVQELIPDAFIVSFQKGSKKYIGN